MRFSELFLLPFILVPRAHAGVEDQFVSRVRDKFGYKCTDVVSGGNVEGYECLGDGAYHVLIPRDLPAFTTTILYFHGDRGKCDGGAAGENYLRDFMPTMRRNNAVAVVPDRADSRDYSFDVAAFTARVDQILGAAKPLVMAAHSYGGKFVLRELAAHTSVMPRVRLFFFLDATYDISTIMLPMLSQILPLNSSVKIRSITTTSQAGSNAGELKRHLDAEYPGMMSQTAHTSENHCQAISFFSSL